MNDDRTKRSQFNLSGLLGFIAFCIILGALISLHSRTLDWVSALVFLGLRVALGLLLVGMVWSSRRRGGAKWPAVPEWYRKWVLGEDNSTQK